MNKKHTFKVGKYISMACLLFVCATVQSCRDEYYYDDREPDWLGESIYDYLEEKGNFTLFMKVIEDLNYKEVLSKTGSKTLFVADDDAFIKGIQEEWGFNSYDSLTLAHKRIILYNAMLDNAYLLELMSNMPAASANAEPVIGRCLRQETSANTTDSIGYFYDADLPQNNKDWDRFRESGIRLALDATKTTMVHFLEEQLYQNSINAEDVNILLNHRYNATTKDAFIFDKMVIDQNVTCKNGYVHQLDGLLIPPSNMAEEIRTSGKTNAFSRMLDRFAVPVPNATLTAEYNRIYHYGDDANAERVYEKRYYTANSNRGASGNYLSYRDIDDIEHQAEGSLYFDPGWNEYRSGVNSSTAKENDMAAIFAPSDAALNEYFTSGEGEALIERFKHVDSIPLEHIQYLLRNMMKNSFNATVPSRFESIMDDARDPMGVEKSHIDSVIIANNGVVYITNKVYSPARYVAVTAPVLFSDTLKIANWAVNKYEYDKYLLSMGSTFSFVVPSDGCIKYLNPASFRTGQKPTMYVFKWNPKAKAGNEVYAETWECDPLTLDTLKKLDNLTNTTLIEDLFREMYEYYIVVGDFVKVPREYTGMKPNKYHMAKGYGTVKVETEEDGVDEEGYPKFKVTNIAGGYQVQNGTSIPMGHIYSQKNGKTYRLDEAMIQPATQSVYKVMSDSINHPEFSKFYELCMGSYDVLETIAPLNSKGKPNTDSIKRYVIFESLNGLDQNVRTFDTYHYTVYIPTNDKIDEAYEAGLPRWEDMDIEAELIKALAETEALMKDTIGNMEVGYNATQEEYDAYQAQIDTLAAQIAKRKAVLKKEVEVVVDFVKYHFQDNSVYVDNLPHSIKEGDDTKYVVDYETSTLDAVTKRFCTLRVQTTDGYSVHNPAEHTISVSGDITGMDNTCYVMNKPGTEGQLYNIMTRDIEFSSATASTATINTSSYAVIHQIDGFLVHDRFFKFDAEKAANDPNYKGEFIK